MWQPLLRGKFGERADEVGMVWFWGKIHLRMASRGKGMQKEKLGYLDGSFGQVTDALVNQIRNAGGEIHTSSPVERIAVEEGRVKSLEMGGQVVPFDAIIATVSSPAFLNMTPQLAPDYAQKLKGVNYQAAACLVLTIKKQLSPFYWINISDTSVPFVAAIEHTNIISESRYGGKRILYLSNYLSADSPLYHKNAEELLATYLPHIKKINPEFEPDWIEDLYLFHEDAGQPIIGTNYSQNIPPLRTPIEGLYLANTTQIYPEDRGMNYSVRLGQDVTKLINEDLSQA
jgi:protoporphyrinogen oxidase